MGKVLQGTGFEPTPLAQIREKGKVFVGIYGGSKPGKKPGSQIHLFQIKAGTTADTVLPTDAVDAKGAKVYATCDVDLGAEVVIFGDTQLNDKLGQATKGGTITITSNGKVQTKSGNWMNDYQVVEE